MEQNPKVKERIPQGIVTYLKRFYYDTALSASSYALRPLQELADPSHILFGADYPFAPEPMTAATVAGIGEYDGFDEQTRMDIERNNFLPLFPRLGQE
jgi:predicted TIM-barrel fold metal-dependent hydrolase